MRKTSVNSPLAFEKCFRPEPTRVIIRSIFEEFFPSSTQGANAHFAAFGDSGNRIRRNTNRGGGPAGTDGRTLFYEFSQQGLLVAEISSLRNYPNKN